MKVQEQLAEPKFDETPPAEALELPAPSAPEGAPSVSEPSWLRLAYAFEFLLAVLVVDVSWSEIGGEGHLDIMPWFIKLACITLLAWSTVRFTAAIVENRQPWNLRSRLWLCAILLVIAAMSCVTYYYHLHEGSDDPGSDEASTTVSNQFSEKLIAQA
jgi:hypothetical protein